MLTIEYTTQFKKDFKLAKKRNKSLGKLRQVIDLIVNQKILSLQVKNHLLKGRWKNYYELHIEPNWLLIYKVDVKNKTTIFVRTGTHADLF